MRIHKFSRYTRVIARAVAVGVVGAAFFSSSLLYAADNQRIFSFPLGNLSVGNSTPQTDAYISVGALVKPITRNPATTFIGTASMLTGVALISQSSSAVPPAIDPSIQEAMEAAQRLDKSFNLDQARAEWSTLPESTLQGRAGNLLGHTFESYFRPADGFFSGATVDQAGWDRYKVIAGENGKPASLEFYSIKNRNNFEQVGAVSEEVSRMKGFINSPQTFDFLSQQFPNLSKEELLSLIQNSKKIVAMPADRFARLVEQAATSASDKAALEELLAKGNIYSKTGVTSQMIKEQVTSLMNLRLDEVSAAENIAAEAGQASKITTVLDSAATAVQDSKLLSTAAKVDGFLASKLAPTVEKAGEWFGKIAKPLAVPIAAIGEYLASKFPNVASWLGKLLANPATKQALGVLGGAAGVVFGGLALYYGIKDGLEDTSELIKKIQTDGWGALATSAGASTALRAASDWLLAASGGLGIVAGATAITGVGGAGFGLASLVTGGLALALKGAAWAVDGGAAKIADAIGSAVDAGYKALENAVAAVGNAAEQVVNKVGEAAGAVVAAITTTVSKVVEVVKQVPRIVYETATRFVDKVVPVVRQVVDYVTAKVQETYQYAAQEVHNVVETVMQNVQESYQVVRQAPRQITEWVTTKVAETKQVARTVYDTVTSYVTQWVNETVPVVTQVVRTVWETVTSWVPQTIRSGWGRFVSWVTQMVARVTRVPHAIYTTVTNYVTRAVAKTVAVTRQVARTVYDTITEWVNKTVPVIKTVYDTVVDTAYRWVQKPVQIVKQVFETVWRTGTRLVDKVVPVVRQVTDYVTQKVTETYQVAKTVYDTVVERIAG